MSATQSPLLYIPLKNIRENPVALRPVDKTGEKYLQLVDSVKQHGVLNAISVRPIDPAEDGTPQYSVCDGLHRYTAANDAGLTEIACTVKSLTDAEAEEAQIVANFHKVETKPAEYSKALNRIVLRNPDLTLAELGSRLNMSGAQLSERMSLVKLSENIQKLVDEGSIKLTNAVALAKLPVEMQPDFVERAMTQSPAEFVPAVNTAHKQHREAIKAGRTPGEATFEAIPLLQKLGDIKTGLAEYKSLANELISAAGADIKEPADIFGLAIKWVLRLDPVSVAKARQKWDAEQAEKKRKKDAAAAERQQKKDEAAKAAAMAI